MATTPKGREFQLEATVKNQFFPWIGVAVVLQLATPCTLHAALITSITEGLTGPYTIVSSVVDGGPGLQDGSEAFVDRSNRLWTGPSGGSIASYLLGLEYVKTRNNDKDNDNLAVAVTFGDFARVYLFDYATVNVPVTGAMFTTVDTNQIALNENGPLRSYWLRQAVVAPGDTITIGRGSTLMWGLAVAPRPSVLQWEGDSGTGWNDGTDAVDTNWTDGTTAPGDQVKPMSGNDLVFTSAGTYSGDLDLGGATFELNSITIGQAGNTLEGGLSDFGVTNRVLASNGLIRLGAGGLTVTMMGNTDENEPRNIRINADIELTADTTIRRNTNFGEGSRNRSLYFGGVISGGSVENPLELVIDNAGTGSANKAIRFEKANNFVANVDLNGVLIVSNAAGLGHPSNTYTLNQGVYLQMTSSGELTTEYDFTLAPGASASTLLARFGDGSWTFNGNITEGHSDKALEILTNSNDRRIIFAGAEQSFLNKVELWGGSKVIIAAADPSGIAWPNAGRILLNRSNLSSSLTTDLLMRGDFTLNQDIEVANITNNNRVYIGQVNDGTTAFDATFNGRINVLEPDVEVLHLTADAEGRATFTGEINVAGTFGLRKIGQGTVAVAGRVSQGQGNTTPIGTVNVQEGTLLVNSPGGNDSFFTTGIDVHDGATLGGTGTIVGGAVNIRSGGTLATGQSVGTLTFGDDLTLQAGAIWDWQYLNTGSYDQADGARLVLPAAGEVVLNILGLVSDPQFAIHYGDEFTIFTGDVPDFDPARFNLIDGASGWTRGWTISTGNSLILTAVPEPGSLLLLLAGAAALLPGRLGRKRQRQM